MSQRKAEGVRKNVASRDPSMELATEQLTRLVSRARDIASRSPTSRDLPEALGELCRFLRTSKVLLRECMESYPSYFDHFEGFIEQALSGCSLVDSFKVSSSLRESLNRHSQDIENLRARYKEEQATDTGNDSIGEIYSGAVVSPKSKPRSGELSSV